MRRPKHPRPSQRAQACLLMIRHEKLPRRFLLKPLLAAPRHILDHEQRAVGDEDHIQRSMRNDRFIQSFDHGGQDREARGRGIIFFQDARGTFGPGAEGRVDGGLDVGAVEVDFRPRGEVVEGAREAEDVPEEGAGGGDLVDVETGVDEGDGGEDVVEEVAARGGGVGRRGEGTRGWEGEVGGEEGGVVAGGGAGVDRVCEGLIEGEEVGVCVDEGDGGDYDCSQRSVDAVWGAVSGRSIYFVPARYLCLCSGRRSGWPRHHSRWCRSRRAWHWRYTVHNTVDLCEPHEPPDMASNLHLHSSRQ